MMTDSPQLREQCAQQLLAARDRVPQLTAFLGLDGFVDEIIHAVDKRQNAEAFERVPTIARLAERLAAAAGKSTNVELVNQRTKLGGNGPIMANAMAALGVKVTYVGALGHPTIHPVFQELTHRAEVISLTDAAHTDALEFDDGKLLFGKLSVLNEITWPTICQRWGREPFFARFSTADLVGFVNWTMIPYMSDVWAALLAELCPQLNGERRTLFFDLADPEKRLPSDIQRALELIVAFDRYFDVILGLNEKESFEVAKVLGIAVAAETPEGLAERARQIHQRLPVHTLVIHPVTYALAVSQGEVQTIKGLYTSKPRITTGAGDHFNSGFCLGKLLGLDNALALLTGVTTSGYYVREGQSPNVAQVAETLRRWPNE